MRNDDIIRGLLDKGQSLGLDPVEIMIQSNRTLSARIFQGELDSYSLADGRGLGLRGNYQGRMGYSYTEKLHDETVDFLLEETRSNAQQFDEAAAEEIQLPSGNYPEFSGHNPRLAAWEGQDLVEWIRELALDARQYDDRVRLVNAGMGLEERQVTLENTLGMNLKSELSLLSVYLHIIAGEEERHTGTRMQVVGDFDLLDRAKLVQGAVEDAVSLFGARPLTSGSYPTVLRNDVVTEFLSAFWPAFSAEQGQKGLSLLHDKLGEEIASPLVDIVDHPLLAARSGSSPFDGEGIASRRKELVKQGVLLVQLHNSQTAKRGNTTTTGNASRASYKAPVKVAPSNLYIAPGDGDQEQLLSTMGKGLFITSVQGMHSGTNPVSGDFSVAASGFEVAQGALLRPVDQITIAGNFFRLLQDIAAVGDDLLFQGRYGAPGLLVKELAVSGT